MRPFPQDRSVLILDNCAIHKSDTLRQMVEAKGVFIAQSVVFLSLMWTGCKLIFLPPYSPDLNPIEESFSACKHLSSLLADKYSCTPSEGMAAPPLPTAAGE